MPSESHLLINLASDPATKRLLNLRCNPAYEFVPEVQGIEWIFLKRMSKRKTMKNVTELWKLKVAGQAMDVKLQSISVKENIPSMERIFQEIAGQNVDANIITPIIGYVTNSYSTDANGLTPSLITPFIPGKNLGQWIDSEMLGREADWRKMAHLFISCLNTMKGLHSISCKDVASGSFIKHLSEKVILCDAGTGFPADRIILNSLIKAARRKKHIKIVSELEGFGISFVHRDCFPSNLVIDPQDRIFLIDFEAIDLGSYVEDLSQLAASFIVYLIRYGANRDNIDFILRGIADVYGKSVSDSISFRILLLKALARFSPLSRKYFHVMNMGNLTMRKQFNIVGYPKAVFMYYSIFRKYLGELIDKVRI